MKRLFPRVALAAALACLVTLFAAPGSFADYGSGAQFQVEISANDVGGVPGHGLWLWFELDQAGSVNTGDYAGSSCIHSGSDGLNAATPLRGDVTWSDDGTNLTITGIVLHLHDRTIPLTVIVPDTTGHYAGPSGDFLVPNIIGVDAQVEVAP